MKKANLVEKKIALEPKNKPNKIKSKGRLEGIEFSLSKKRIEIL